MKVILLTDIKGTGKKDQVVEVSDGYARNYLLPRKMAMEATAAQLNAIKNAKSAEEHKRQREREEAVKQAERLKGITLKVVAKAGSTGKLFGAVTSQEIADALAAQQGIRLDKRRIALHDPIKTIGPAECEVKLFSEISARIKLEIQAEG